MVPEKISIPTKRSCKKHLKATSAGKEYYPSGDKGNSNGKGETYMLCDCCKKEESVIQISGVGHFCMKCHNDRMLKHFEKQDDFNYQETIYIYEKNGNVHQFELNHLILGAIVSWEANETGGGYHVKEISHIDDDTGVVINRFYQKIITAVRSKTIEKRGTEHRIDNLLLRNEQFYSLANKGTISIEDNRHGDIVFRIDGEVFTPDEMAKMLGSYAGFSMQYQIHDATDPVLAEDELLMPVKVGKKQLTEDLLENINRYSDGENFISYKDVFNFEEAVGSIIDRLELLYNSFRRDEAKEIGEELIHILQNIETDDDWFPENEVDIIRNIIERI